jgi:cytoskeleton protein RodZ
VVEHVLKQLPAIGICLRTARECRGETAAEIADQLCITQRYVLAIENGDISQLPGVFFYKSFVRQYAALVGVDEAVLGPALAEVSALDESGRPEIRIPDPLVQEGNRRYVPDIAMSWSVAGLAAVLLICSGFYTWWTRAPQSVSASAPAPIPAPFVAAKSEPPALPEAPLPEAADLVPKSASGLETSAAQQQSPAGPLQGVVLKLSATEATWLSISSGGKEIFSGILQPSESKTLTGLDIATVRVGNAAGLDVSWNGKQIGPLGGRGQVLTVRFTPDDFQILTQKL